MDPNSLAVACCPVAWLPDVIGAAYVISGTVQIVRPITHLDSDGTRITRVSTSSIIRATTIIRSVTRIGTVVASTAD
jgi:hypothetical protein